jgi:glutamate-5-semialdehyde dehydrogenase
MFSMSEVRDKAILAKAVTPLLGQLSTDQKNEALRLMAEALIAETDSIITSNIEDIERGKANGIPSSMLDRLSLNPSRIAAIAEGLREIIVLDDPIGDLLEESARPNGLLVRKVRVPLGLIGIIYEARPNVTVDAAGLCLKSGNAVLLRGGSDALSSNKRIVEVLHSALALSDIPVDALQLVTNPDRASVDEMLKLNGILDVIIPRGGHSLIQNVIKNATVPAIETGAGICHTYADNEADPAKALRIAINAKAQRPSVCNSMETLLIQSGFAESHLRAFADAFADVNVELRGCANTLKLIPGMKAATEEDWATEYNDYILNIKIVADLDEAIAHIRQYSTMHSECIVTENEAAAKQFMEQIDAAAVYHNASTRFTDGFEFGYGAEIGISTQKLHARGPMGLPALTTTKFYVHGNGQIRQ